MCRTRENAPPHGITSADELKLKCSENFSQGMCVCCMYVYVCVRQMYVKDVHFSMLHTCTTYMTVHTRVKPI